MLWLKTSSSGRVINRYYEKMQHILIYSGFLINYALLSFIVLYGIAGADKLKLLSPLIVVAFIASALLKVRIANIFYILKKSTIYSLFLFIFIFSYIAATVYLFNYFQIIDNIYAIYYMALFFILFAIIFRPIVDYIRNFIDSHIFKIAFNYKQIVDNFSRKISALVQFQDIIGLVSTTFGETFKLNAVLFYNLTLPSADIEVLYGEKSPGKPPKIDDVISYFSQIYPLNLNIQKFEPLFVNYLSSDKLSAEFLNFLTQYKISIIFPVYHENIILGFYFLGYKYMKDEYNDDDIQLITTVLNQAQVAFSNAKIYNNLLSSNNMLEKTIIELKNTQNELAKKEKLAALGHLAANVAHEVKNPLGIMKVAASTLESALGEKPRLKDLASFINKEIDRLNSFVSELLDFTKNRDLKLSDVNLDGLIDEVIEKTAMYAKSENKIIELNKKIISGGAQESLNLNLHIDYDQILRALINITFNAADAIDEQKQGMIIISASKSDCGDCIVITVEDNGRGINQTHLKSVIQPFYTTRKKGTGLGLAVASQIFEKHGGRLEIKSEENNGTKVALYLPLKGA
jgi:signal transduction histidine kinase